MSIINTLKELSLIPGISGQEDLVRDYIINKVHGKCEYSVDTLGNVICFKKGEDVPKNSLMFSAHMDEVGFIVTGINDEGYLRFANVGGIDSRVIFGKAVQVGKNMINGVIGGAPVHLVERADLTKPVDPDKMLIDIGAKDKEDAEKYVTVGDYVVFNAPFLELGDDTILGKAFDDRAGCAIMIDMINSDLPYDATFTFTVQEEVGCIGGQTAAYNVNPDIGVVLESTTASDIGGVEKDMHVCTQGKGPVISFMDRGAVYDKKLFDLTLKTAKDNDIPVQVKQGVFGGNEARVIQTSRSGAGVVGVSLPTRYLHSPSSTVKKQDIKSMRALLDKLIIKLAEV